MLLYCFIGSSLIISFIYKKYCKKIGFNKINKQFERKEKYEFDLSIYKPSLPISYTNNKKNRCVLLISGYRDTPYLWNLFTEYLNKHGVDYYAPRTFSKGRTFFQYCSYKDWILTYFEMLQILQYQYENIDIIALSAGSFITMYISQFEYECNINNIFLCSPYLCVRDDTIYNICYKTFLFPFVDLFIKYVLDPIIKFRLKSNDLDFKCVRNIYDQKNLNNDYYEFISSYFSDNEILKMIKLKINPIKIKGNLNILYTEKDSVIPTIEKQLDLIKKNNMFIETKENKLVVKKLHIDNSVKDKCGHVIFKESDNILNDVSKYIFNNLNSYYIATKDNIVDKPGEIYNFICTNEDIKSSYEVNEFYNFKNIENGARKIEKIIFDSDKINKSNKTNESDKSQETAFDFISIESN